jgi:2,3-dihydroxybenzoate decarboxylase
MQKEPQEVHFPADTTDPRFRGFASLSMHDPHQAAQELKRAIKELGLFGVMLNDFQEAENGSKMLFYDQLEYDPFWAMVQELDVPVYIHPRRPIKQISHHMWRDRIALLSAPFQPAQCTSYPTLSRHH